MLLQVILILFEGIAYLSSIVEYISVWFLLITTTFQGIKLSNLHENIFKLTFLPFRS